MNPYVVKTLAHIKEMGACAGLAVNPDTSVASISEILNLCDYVMVMTVNPGFSGQAFIDFTRNKIRQLAELKQRYGYKLMIDGHCSPEIVEELSLLGVDGFILGTSALFRKGRTYGELIRELRGEPLISRTEKGIEALMDFSYSVPFLFLFNRCANSFGFCRPVCPKHFSQIYPAKIPFKRLIPSDCLAVVVASGSH